MNLKVIISIDDVNPKPGWQILGTPVEGWLRSLNEEFGARFTCFVPSNYHREFPLSKNKEWIKELNSVPFMELAAHGHLHMTSDPKRFGECEFAELDNGEEINNVLILDLEKEWRNSLGIDISELGWKNPGWLCSDRSKQYIERYFKYVSLHYEHNRGMNWKCKTFFGHDGIQQTDISTHNGDMIMLTSHVSGDWNENVWNEKNYDQLRLSLSYLVENYTCEFKTLKECM
jgi:hypothetical protein